MQGYNEVGLQSARNCSASSTLDTSAPFVGLVVDARTAEALPERYIRLANLPCTHWANVSDPHSGVPLLSLQLMRVQGDVAIAASAPRNVANPAPQGSMCHFSAEDIESGGTYFSQLTATNGAGMIQMAEGVSQFTVDETPPEAGTLDLQIVMPDRFDLQPTFPQNVSGVELQVSLRDFRDLDSGLAECVVNVSDADSGDTIQSRRLPYVSSLTFAVDGPLANNTWLVASAMCSNRLGMLGAASASPPRLVHLVAIDPGSVFFTDAFGERVPTGAEFLTQSGSLGIRYTGATDPADPNAIFTYTWSLLAGGSPSVRLSRASNLSAGVLAPCRPIRISNHHPLPSPGRTLS